MGFVVAVTIDTIRKRLAMFLVGFVTVAALGFEMRACCFEVGKGVVETFLHKNDDLGIPAFVLALSRSQQAGWVLPGGIVALLAGLTTASLLGLPRQRGR